jgi:response regulator RpfG family c-di-GMP phosphodiesterase
VSRLITKPCDPDQFRDIVSGALAQSQLILENRRLREVADEQAARLEQWNQRLEELVNQRTTELEQANASLQRGLLDGVRLLIGFLEGRLPERANRCREVARLVGRLAERARVAPETARRVQVAALVHDIGLMGLPDPILRQSPDDMPHAARVQYEQHPIIGQSMLSSVEHLVQIATWIRHHHERWDGRGYPDRLAGPAIPLPSRLIALADGYIEAVARDGGTAARWRSAQRAAGAYDPDLVEVLAVELDGVSNTPTLSEIEIPVTRLEPGFRLAAPISSAAGAVLVNSGEIISAELARRLQALAASGVLASETVGVFLAR